VTDGQKSKGKNHGLTNILLKIWVPAHHGLVIVAVAA